MSLIAISPKSFLRPISVNVSGLVRPSGALTVCVVHGNCNTPRQAIRADSRWEYSCHATSHGGAFFGPGKDLAAFILAVHYFTWRMPGNDTPPGAFGFSG
jgi:hypothetical protein